MSPLWNLIIDGVLAMLLIAAIASCMIVYKRLAALRSGQDEMKKLVEDLNNAVVEAQRSVGGLKHAAVEAEATLQTQIQRAKSLAEELVMITEAGNNLADRIEKKLTKGGSSADLPKGSEPEGRNPSAGVETKKSIRPEQKELLDALKEAR